LGSEGSLSDEASEVEGDRQDITQDGGFGGIEETKAGSAFELATPLIGIAGFSIGEAAEAQMPGGGIDLEVTGQADGAIGEVQGSGEAETEGVALIPVGTAVRSMVRVGGREIGMRAMLATLAADPLGLVALVVMAVAVQAEAMRAERGAVFVEAALETGEGVLIARGMAQFDGTESLEVLVDKGEDLIEAFTGIAKDFSDGEGWEALQQLLETGDGEQVVVAVGGGEGAGQGPIGEEAVIDDVEGFGLVTEMMLAAGG
jgi:hypothetical protein